MSLFSTNLLLLDLFNVQWTLFIQCDVSWSERICDRCVSVSVYRSMAGIFATKRHFCRFSHPIHFATVEEFSPDPSRVKCSGSVAVKVLEKASGTVIIVIPNPSRIVMPRRGRRLVLDPLLRSCHASVPWTSLHKHHHSYHYHQPIVAPRATYRLFSFVWK